MKRKLPIPEVPKRYGCRTIYPLFFWKECDICGWEYKRESIHFISIRWFRNYPGGIIVSSGGVVDKFYYCRDCYKTLEEAEKHFVENELSKYG